MKQTDPIHKVILRNIFILILISFLVLPNTAFSSAGNAQQVGSIQGSVIDVQTSEPVGDVYILLDEYTNFTRTNAAGRFRISGIPVGEYHLTTYRVGYQPHHHPFVVHADSVVRLTLQISQDALTSGEIVIEGERDTTGYQQSRAINMSGEEVREQMGVTIAGTLSDQPGIAERSMGPAPARPVLRGLSGDRVKILQDGGEPGDLSATSADHAVAIEPLTTERIEVLRGPAALLYSSNVLGGIVNVIRHTIPDSRVTRFRGTGSFQGGTVNEGFSGGLNLDAPVGPFSVTVDGSYRKTKDMVTPEGTLNNTAILTRNGSAGASWHHDRGFLGFAANYYVDIQLFRRQLETRGAYQLNSPILKSLNWQGGYTFYHHEEYETDDVIGIEYGVLTYHFKSLIHFQPWGVFTNGEAGFSAQYRDYAAGGFSFTPETTEQTLSGFVYQETAWNRWTLDASLRFDHRLISPREERISERIGHIRQQDFSDVSGALAVSYRFNSALTSGFMFLRSFRPPTLEELYSEGPHLAAYAFEIGNPELSRETGTGIEWQFTFHRAPLAVHGTLFYNRFSGYIFPGNTGETNFRTLLPLYQYQGVSAELRGVELTAALEINRTIQTRLIIEYVSADNLTNKRPLPLIPPLTGKLTTTYTGNSFSAEFGLRAAASQNRIAQFESTTDGYFVADFQLEYTRPALQGIHKVTLSVRNIFDTVYRQHLSRVKSIMPEPGRNLRLGYYLYF